MSQHKDRFSDSNHWSRFAAFYERHSEPLTGPFAEAALARLPTLHGHRLLDVATGTGILARAAARAGAQVLAIDFAEDMVAYARRHLQLHPGCSAQVMDGQALALPDGSFHIATSMFGVMMFPDFRCGLSELVRVTEPGGYVVVGVWENPIGAGPNQMLREILISLQPDLTLPEPPAGMVALCEADGLQTELRAAGCKAVEVHREEGAWAAPDVDAAIAQVAELLACCPVPMYETVNALGREAVLEALRDKFAGQCQSDGRVVVPAAARIAIGRR